jgi:hypothetical protein
MKAYLSQKAVLCGLMFLGFAAGFLWFGQGYRLGTASRMGPGYFPMALACLLAAIGAISLIRAYFVRTGPIAPIAWRPLALVTLAIASFAVLLKPAGLAVALPALVAISAGASEDSRYGFKEAVLLMGLFAFCALVFAGGLGIPMPIFGSGFDGILPDWMRI